MMLDIADIRPGKMTPQEIRTWANVSCELNHYHWPEDLPMPKCIRETLYTCQTTGTVCYAYPRQGPIREQVDLIFEIIKTAVSTREISREHVVFREKMMTLSEWKAWYVVNGPWLEHSARDVTEMLKRRYGWKQTLEEHRNA